MKPGRSNKLPQLLELCKSAKNGLKRFADFGEWGKMCKLHNPFSVSHAAYFLSLPYIYLGLINMHMIKVISSFMLKTFKITMSILKLYHTF